ncbi:hypothetical protein [Phaeobacter sp. 11ANDIMAR09]|nr:hypothetical protein [Phaeobacter sp. 11ANDIMAR09]
MTKFTPPTSGGRFELQRGGKLKQVEHPTKEATRPEPSPPENPTKEQEA